MGRRRARAYEQERPDGPQLQRVQDAEQAEEQGGAQGEVLRLQEAAGNGAVSRMLVQRDGATANQAVPMDTGEAVKATLILDDRLGVFPLISFSKGTRKDEYLVVIPSTDLDAVLANYNVKGTRIEKAKISTQNFDIDLDDVLITSVDPHKVGGDNTTAVTLNFAAEHFTRTMTP